MIRTGILLAVAGLVGYVAGVHHAPSPWWLVPPGLLAAGIGVGLAGVVAAARRRLLPFRAARRAAGPLPSAGGPVRRLRAVPVMVVDAWRGRGTLPRSQTVLWLVALVYLVSPLDVIADVVFPLIGIPGDIGLVAWLLATVYTEAGHYVHARDTDHDVTARPAPRRPDVSAS